MYTFSREPPRLASTGQRAAAFVADVVLVLTIVLVLYSLGGTGRAGELDTGVTQRLNLASLLVFPAFLAYFTITEGVWGTTLGKRLVGIRVESLRSGGGAVDMPMDAGASKTPGLYDAFIRTLLRFLWMIPLLGGDAVTFFAGVSMLGLDLFVMLRSEFDQRIGDHAASTVVVQ